jgi:hypothetical protein
MLKLNDRTEWWPDDQNHQMARNDQHVSFIVMPYYLTSNNLKAQLSLNFKLFSKYDLEAVRLLKLYTATCFCSGMVRKWDRLPTYLTFVVDLFGISGERPLKYEGVTKGVYKPVSSLNFVSDAFC